MSKSCGFHAAFQAQDAHPLNVDGAPRRRGLARREANLVRSSSMRMRTPSIQPTHSALSTDSGQVMLGLPVSRL
jgi:hypothetical protein